MQGYAFKDCEYTTTHIHNISPVIHNSTFMGIFRRDAVSQLRLVCPSLVMRHPEQCPGVLMRHCGLLHWAERGLCFRVPLSVQTNHRTQAAHCWGAHPVIPKPPPWAALTQAYPPLHANPRSLLAPLSLHSTLLVACRYLQTNRFTLAAPCQNAHGRFTS